MPRRDFLMTPEPQIREFTDRSGRIRAMTLAQIPDRSHFLAVSLVVFLFKNAISGVTE